MRHCTLSSSSVSKAPYTLRKASTACGCPFLSGCCDKRRAHEMRTPLREGGWCAAKTGRGVRAESGRSITHDRRRYLAVRTLDRLEVVAVPLGLEGEHVKLVPRRKHALDRLVVPVLRVEPHRVEGGARLA
eukprot:6335729-Prymnesium_polylepis.1